MQIRFMVSYYQMFNNSPTPTHRGWRELIQVDRYITQILTDPRPNSDASKLNTNCEREGESELGAEIL